MDCNNVWRAWTDEEFNPKEYIYHYTPFETALKILHSNQIRLSPLSKTNDTTEQKVRIDYDFTLNNSYTEKITKLEKYWMHWTTNSKLLCFGQDTPKSNRCVPKSADPLDMSGRGFALPRMWAQYASNNSGVCLILRKKDLVDAAYNSYPSAICESVAYFDLADSFKIPKDLFDRFVTVIDSDPDTEYAARFLQERPDFSKYSYFSKFKDWEGEREFRILVPSSRDGYLYIHNVNDYLAGIVLGEYMDPSIIHAINATAPSSVPVRKIVFRPQRCLVEAVDSI